jgi:hypothetical protein
MTCPRCFADFEPGTNKCPECGVQFVHNVSGVMKTSAVMIAAAGEQGFYRSVQEVPEPLRTQLLEITTSSNSGTIVIADRAGKEQITQVIGRRQAAARERAPVAPESPAKREWPARFLGLSWILWAGVVLLLGASGIIVGVFAIH